METQFCPVKECGARVVMVQVDGRPFPVNPIPLELVVPMGEEKFRVVEGYQPHHVTCVNIAARRRPAGSTGN